MLVWVEAEDGELLANRSGEVISALRPSEAPELEEEPLEEELAKDALFEAALWDEFKETEFDESLFSLELVSVELEDKAWLSDEVPDKFWEEEDIDEVVVHPVKMKPIRARVKVIRSKILKECLVFFVFRLSMEASFIFAFHCMGWLKVWSVRLG